MLQAIFFGLLTYATSSYAMFCDQDDYWEPNKVELEYVEMKKAEDSLGQDVPMLVFTDSTVVNEDLELLQDSFVSTLGFDPKIVTLPQVVMGNVAQGCTILMNKALVTLALSEGAMPEFAFHDWWMMILAKAFGETSYLDISTMRYRQHEKNVVGATDKSLREWVWHIVKRPALFIGASDRAREDFLPSIERARIVRDLLGDRLSEGDRQALDEIASLPSLKLNERVKIYKKYGLKGRTKIQDRAYRYLGLISL